MRALVGAVVVAQTATMAIVALRAVTLMVTPLTSAVMAQAPIPLLHPPLLLLLPLVVVVLLLPLVVVLVVLVLLLVLARRTLAGVSTARRLWLMASLLPRVTAADQRLLPVPQRPRLQARLCVVRRGERVVTQARLRLRAREALAYRRRQRRRRAVMRVCSSRVAVLALCPVSTARLLPCSWIHLSWCS
jgi:hypothetical protein